MEELQSERKRRWPRDLMDCGTNSDIKIIWPDGRIEWKKDVRWEDIPKEYKNYRRLYFDKQGVK